MRDVAAHLGISHATVSRALRHDSRITETVRLSVIKAANKLGYKRDPKLSALMSHVRASKERAFQGTLAWITDHDLELPAELAAHHLFWDGSYERASELGYKLECFPKTGPADSTRLERIFRARGIQGVILQQFKTPFDLAAWEWDWRRFSTIQNGAYQSVAQLDSVDSDDMWNCLLLLQTLAQHGYKRIGIATTRIIEETINFSLSTSRYRFSLLQPEHPVFPHCLLPDLSRASGQKVARWIKQHQVDCMVSQARGMKELLESIGLQMPRDMGFAYQGVIPQHKNSGIWQRENTIASVAIETLVASVEQGRFGLPSVPRITLIPGIWHQGVTCR